MISTSLGSTLRDLLNRSLSSAPRLIIISNLSPAGAAVGPLAANVSSVLLASMRCFGDAPVSSIMFPRTSGALTTNCCARSRFAAPFLTRRIYGTTRQEPARPGGPASDRRAVRSARSLQIGQELYRGRERRE